ncbi:type II toxin-antitoxin system VapC family toxin [Mycobacteroides abscessus]|uniref:type II toxin-antitoxin system VapC family toxin n=1 Tax=Mycobacteroides abscessus TaxID=36809 RepID=UPI002107E0F9|nr:type II toxin-antitoxin system VapC family toxin [Mycobacteroides abscessus]
MDAMFFGENEDVVVLFGDYEFSRLERYGIALANATIRRLRAQVARPSGDLPPVEGPHFMYEQGPQLFLGRRGRGALHIAWDTNLLIDYFEHGRALWEGESLSELLPGEHGEQLEALQIIVTLWVLRDIRFHILPRTITDSKRKELSPERREQRLTAWREFCAAVRIVADEDEYRGETLILPRSELDRALAEVPAGNDRELVAAAVRNKVHVFLTRDRGVLRAGKALRPFGLYITSPQDLLEDLACCGALSCLLQPEHLYWPMPDQQRVAHLVSALLRADPNPEAARPTNGS